MDNSDYKKFNIYRYQLLPISQEIQLPLLDQEIKAAEDLIAKKNILFSEALKNIKEFSHPWGEIVHQIQADDDLFFTLKFAVKRKFHRENPDFTVEDIDNWPKILVIINNQPDTQIVAIQVKKSTFEHTKILVNILENNINNYLLGHQLQVHFFPIVESHQFWDLVAKYEGQIIRAYFEMISPNMSNISKNLDDTFKLFIQNSNSQVTHLDIKSDKSSSLSLNENDNFLNGIVNYILEGSGRISLKIKQMKKIIHTDDNLSEVTISDLQIENASSKDLASLLTVLLK